MTSIQAANLSGHPGPARRIIVGGRPGVLAAEGRTAVPQSEHAGRISAIFGRVSFSRVSGAVAAVKRTGHRSALNLLGLLARWSFPRVKFCQEPSRGLSNRLGSFRVAVASHEQHVTGDRGACPTPDGSNPTLSGALLS